MSARGGAALAQEVASLLADPLWVRVEGEAETGSTNDDARALAAGGGARGDRCRRKSTERRAGGVSGRAWESPEGGAYVSVVLRPPTTPAQTGPLALVIALGIAAGL